MAIAIAVCVWKRAVDFSVDVECFEVSVVGGSVSTVGGSVSSVGGSGDR